MDPARPRCPHLSIGRATHHGMHSCMSRPQSPHTFAGPVSPPLLTECLRLAISLTHLSVASPYSSPQTSESPGIKIFLKKLSDRNFSGQDALVMAFAQFVGAGDRNSWISSRDGAFFARF